MSLPLDLLLALGASFWLIAITLVVAMCRVAGAGRRSDGRGPRRARRSLGLPKADVVPLRERRRRSSLEHAGPRAGAHP